jgi:hypothetical protein
MPRATRKEVSVTASDAVEEKAEEAGGSGAGIREANPPEVSAPEEKKEEVKKVEPAERISGEKVRIRSEKRAGKKIMANTSRIIEFDSEGIAEVSPEEAGYLLSCPGIKQVK